MCRLEGEAITCVPQFFHRCGAYFAPESEVGTSLSQRRRVLVVEDDYFVGLQIEQALKNGGFDVVGVTTNAEEAIALSTEMVPHFVMMDIRLAENGDGVRTALHLYRKIGIRSIFVTAHSDEATRALAKPARPLGWVAKPFTPEGLITAVKLALAQEEKGGW
jgi:two-component system, response regulator PdtaR